MPVKHSGLEFSQCYDHWWGISYGLLFAPLRSVRFRVWNRDRKFQIISS
jgi:hypothetical protein